MGVVRSSPLRRIARNLRDRVTRTVTFEVYDNARSRPVADELERKNRPKAGFGQSWDHR